MKGLIPGLALALAITGSAGFLAQTSWFVQIHISALSLAIILGILCGNLFYNRVSGYLQPGILFAKGTLLRLGIILYGFRISLQDIGQVGISALFADFLVLLFTFLITLRLGIKFLKIDKQVVYLTAVGCSICGAAAIMAAAPVLKAPSHKISVAVALIVIFGTMAMFLYPLLYPYLVSYLSPHQFGIYIGSTIHEVAQVYAAGGNIGPEVADTAVIAKMLRVMMLAPFLFILAWYWNKNDRGREKIAPPYFALAFIATAIFNSSGLLPAEIVRWLVEADNLLLSVAMSGLGLSTSFDAVKQAGTKPFLLGGLVALWLVVGGFAINFILYLTMN
nr:YeiH family protein [Mesocricetibacter intestinalis]